MVRKIPNFRDYAGWSKTSPEESPFFFKVLDVSLVGNIWRAKIYGVVVTAWCVFASFLARLWICTHDIIIYNM